MEHITKAFKFRKNEGESLDKNFNCNIVNGTDKQISFAKDIISFVLADTQGKLNGLFNDYGINSVESLTEYYNDKENTPFMSYDMMIQSLLNFKNATTVITNLKGRSIRAVLDANPNLRGYFDENEIDY